MDNKEITLSVNLNELNIILEGIGQLPLAKVIDVFSKVREQATKQLQETPQVQQ